jgi:hypothetical protein
MCNQHGARASQQDDAKQNDGHNALGSGLFGDCRFVLRERFEHNPR